MKGRAIRSEAEVKLLESGWTPQEFNLDNLPSVWAFDTKVDWLIEDLLPRGMVSLITGDSGVGKSTFALAMAGAIAHGVSFLSRKSRQGASLYVDGENPVGVVRERLERLQIADTPALTVWGGWNDRPPTGPNEDSLLKWAKAHKGLMIFDSLVEFHPGSEQDSSETRKYMRHFRKLANLGATVAVLHHTGKGENARQYRGSSDIKASVDMAYVLEAIGEGGSASSVLRLVPFKCRIAQVPVMRIDFSEGVFKIAGGAVQSNREIVEQVIQDNPNLSGRQIKDLTQGKIAKNRVDELLSQGVEAGWWCVTPGKNSAKNYSVPEEVETAQLAGTL